MQHRFTKEKIEISIYLDGTNRENKYQKIKRMFTDICTTELDIDETGIRNTLLYYRYEEYYSHIKNKLMRCFCELNVDWRTYWRFYSDEGLVFLYAPSKNGMREVVFRIVLKIFNGILYSECTLFKLKIPKQKSLVSKQFSMSNKPETNESFETKHQYESDESID